MKDPRLSVRVTPDEKISWESLAKAEGKTLSNFIRDRVLQSKRERSRPPVTPKRRVVYKDVDPSLLSALGRIGNNINQLARVANENGSLPTLVQLSAIERELKGLRSLCSSRGTGTDVS